MEAIGRIIGIQHRIKATPDGAKVPTKVCIIAGDHVATYDLEDETAELDFVKGRFPIKFRKADADDDISTFSMHHVEWKQLESDEDPASFPKNLIKTEAGKRKNKEGEIKTTYFLATKVPSNYIGYEAHDKIAMVLGGSGDRLAYALARRGYDIGATVYRIPPFLLNQEREALGLEKEHDANTLASLLQTKPELFYETIPRDLDIIGVREAFRARQDAMKARIAAEQRLRARMVGAIFCTTGGYFPEGSVEMTYDARKATDATVLALAQEQDDCETQLMSELQRLEVFKIFSSVKGCGPIISAGIISAVIDIRRFSTAPKFKKFCGVHVLLDGTFPRRKRGATSNWNGAVRQALYLLGDQFVKRPNSEWGLKLIEYKIKLREKHPEEVPIEGTKRKKYTNGHIHKMAIWRTLTKFTEWLYKEWWQTEKQTTAPTCKTETVSNGSN